MPSDNTRRFPLALHAGSSWIGYSLAFFLVISALAVRVAVGLPFAGPRPFLFFYPAIIIASYVGGIGPGVFVGLAAGAFGVCVSSPRPGPYSWFSLIFFGLTIVLSSARLRRLRDRAASFSEESARLRLIIEQVSDWIFLADELGTIEYLNRTACDQLCFDIERMRGCSVEELDAEPETGSIRYLLEQAREGTVAPREIMLRRGDGSTILAEVSCTAIRAGGLVVIHLAARDVTDRKLIDRKLRETLQWESLGALTGGLAHDFNNLLTSIMGNASLAREMLLPQDPVAPLLEAVEESGERCAELIRMMLATSGYRPRSMTTLRVDEMARSIAAAAAKTSPGGVRVHVEAEPCSFESDRGTLDTLLRGLISNAVESCGDQAGEVTVTVRCGHAPEPGGISFEEGLSSDRDYMCIAVEDHGCGMSQEVVERAFNPFFTTKFTGRGLGLPAVRGIVRAHDGLLRLRTAEGEGTRIEVWLPMESYHRSYH